MKECNGSPLLIEIMTHLMEEEATDIVVATLAKPSPALYVLLSIEMQKRRPSASAISSTSNRWKNHDNQLWKGEGDDKKTTVYIQYIQEWMCQLCMLVNPMESKQQCLLLCSKSEWMRDVHSSPEMLDAVSRLGPV